MRIVAGGERGVVQFDYRGYTISLSNTMTAPSLHFEGAVFKGAAPIGYVFEGNFDGVLKAKRWIDRQIRKDEREK